MLDPSPAEVAALTPDARETWRALRSDVRRAVAGTEFDPRHMVRLEGVAWRRWCAARDARIATLLRNDPRVACGG
jgi:hypothetical protein